MTVASMAMYPFSNLRSAYDHLWDGVRSRLTFTAPELDWDLEALGACRRDDLLLGQTCGWPLVTELASTVRVVGTFDCDVDGALDGTYCAVLVTNTGDSLADLLLRPDLTVAANSADSLSGWVSLRSVASAAGISLERVEWTGSHAASIGALQHGSAHLAAIDAVSWALLGGQGLSIVGHGPRVPCLPLVTAGTSSDSLVGELRGAFAATVRDPAMADTCAALRIRDFLVRDLVDYKGLSERAELL
jgi:ABC-type phosphate/phosphonate transport system substrate-binding protein